MWPNGWVDEDATWYGSRHRRRPHCIRRVPSAPRKGHSTPPLLGPCLLWPRSPISATAQLLFVFSVFVTLFLFDSVRYIKLAVRSFWALVVRNIVYRIVSYRIVLSVRSIFAVMQRVPANQYCMVNVRHPPSLYTACRSILRESNFMSNSQASRRRTQQPMST